MSGESENMRHNEKSDPNLVLLVSKLKEESRTKGAEIWRDIALRLEKPSRSWAEVNLSRLERYANEGDIIVVPGKVLGAGSISKKLTVAAYRFSGSAAKKIEAAGGRQLTIPELVKENSTGRDVRIMG